MDGYGQGENNEEKLSDIAEAVRGALEVMNAPEEEVGDIEEESALEVKEEGFYSNLAKNLEKEVLSKLSGELLDDVQCDEESRKEWLGALEEGYKQLGFKKEDRSNIFVGATGEYDTKLLEAVLRFQSIFINYFLPPSGPIKVHVAEEAVDTLREKAKKLELFGNLYLTKLYPQYDTIQKKMAFQVGWSGNAFKKVYLNPIKNKVVSPLISPEDFIVNYKTESLDDAERITHISYYSEKEIRIMQEKGLWLDFPISGGNEEEVKLKEVLRENEHGMVKPQDDKRTTHEIWEIYVDLDLAGYEHINDEGKETGIPLPYIVTIHKASGKILRIVRNWEEGSKDWSRREWFVHHEFLKGSSFYALGLLHVIGNYAGLRTRLLRILTDSGIFASFPGFLKSKTAKAEKNNTVVGPGEGREIETGGLPLSQVVMPLPYKEPSQMLFQAFVNCGESMDRLVGATEAMAAENSSEMAVGTMLAKLREIKKVSNSIFMNLYNSLSREYQLIFRRINENMIDGEPYNFYVGDKLYTYVKEDFDERLDITPTTNPATSSEEEIALKNELLVRTIQALPSNATPYQIEVARKVLADNGIAAADKYLPPLPEEARPMDPVTENQMGINGAPLKAGIEQNHDAHIAVHMPLVEQFKSVASHVQEHYGYKYRLMMQAQMGINLPMGQPLPPEMENQVAVLAMQATQALADKLMPKQQGSAEDAAAQALMAQVQVDKYKADVKAQIDKMKIEADLKKADIKSDDAAAERAKDLKVQQLRNVTELARDRTKQEYLDITRANINKQ